jgi:sugar phosphate isomerase/epimerase
LSRVGISTACYYPQDTFLSFLELLEAEVPVAEVFMNSLAELEKQNLERYRSEMKARGVEIISFHPYTSAFESLMFFSEYSLRKKDGIELYKRFFDGAAYLGAKYFVFHGERITPTFSRGLSGDAAVCESYNMLIETAKSFGLVFTQENVNNHRSQSAGYIKKLSSLVPELRFTFDLKQAMRAHEDYGEIINAMGKKLCHIHINDFGEHECCLPFEGDVDLSDVKNKLCDIGYSGDYILEVYRASFDTNEKLISSLEKTKNLFCK